MAHGDPDLRVALVGLGPRGLGALEALIVAAKDEGILIEVDAFDAEDHPGAGPNFSPDQTEFCLLNTAARALDIAPDPALGADIPIFYTTQERQGGRDYFPTRAELGAYLSRRFASVLKANRHTVKLNCRCERITSVRDVEGAVFVATEVGQSGPYDEVLLTLGQPATRPDPQLEGWIDHAAVSSAVLKSAYPDQALLGAARDWAGKTVAIRGLGLSTMDVLRILTAGVGGVFGEKDYIPSGREPARILPFSLDGQPPAPKPESATVDVLYDLFEEEEAAAEIAMSKAVTQKADEAQRTLCEALMLPVLRILRQAGAVVSARDLEDWLASEREAAGSQTELGPLDALRQNIAIAKAERPPDIGYAVGQVMRKLENTIRKAFNPAGISPDTAEALIAFNEGLGRYAYGPPLRSAQELVMLFEAGIVSLVAADDPNIETVEDGWRLQDGPIERIASVMVDAVIAPPDVSRVADPLFESLVSAGYVSAVADGLGVRTAADGRLIGPEGEVAPRISLLGRMALGSVIAAESIHDCFGAATHRWARGVLERRQDHR